MKITVEITMYPLQDHYIPPIQSFIDWLTDNKTEELKITTYPTCTLLSGDYEPVMTLLKNAIAWSHTNLGKAVFVTKFLPGYQAA